MQGPFSSFELTGATAMKGQTNLGKTVSWVPQPQFKHCADKIAAMNNTCGLNAAPFSDLRGSSVRSDDSQSASLMMTIANDPPRPHREHTHIVWCDTEDDDENAACTPHSGGAVAGKLHKDSQMNQASKTSKLHESFATSEGTLGNTASYQMLSTRNSNDTLECDSPVSAPAAVIETSAVCRVRSLPTKCTPHVTKSSSRRLNDTRLMLSAAAPPAAASISAPSSSAPAATAPAPAPARRNASPAQLYCLSETADALSVVDPQRRKLLIPHTALSPTKGLLGRRSAPSLCLLYQSGRCHQGNNCYQVHADPEVVQQLRIEAERRPCCCAVHEDCNRGSWNPDKLSETVQGVTIHGVGTRIPLSRFAFTVGLEKLMQANVGDPLGASPADYGVTLGHRIVLTTNRDSVCRLHGAEGGCRFGGDCKFIHVCRQLLAFAETTQNNARSIHSLPSPVQALSSPLVNYPPLAPAHLQTAPTAPMPQTGYTLCALSATPNDGYSLCQHTPLATPQPMAIPDQDRGCYGLTPPMLSVSALQSPSHSSASTLPSTTTPQAYYLPAALALTSPHHPLQQPQPQQQVMHSTMGIPQVLYIQQYDVATGGTRIVPLSVVM